MGRPINPENTGESRLRNLIYALRRLLFEKFRVTDSLRRKRMSVFCELMKLRGNELILDVGAGDGKIWGFLPEENFTVIGLDLKRRGSGAFAQFIFGDGCSLPFKDKAFDIIFSNNVLEHVGDAAKQKSMAGEIMRAGKRFFIVAPDKCFPIEPHSLIPFFQFLPLRLQKKIRQVLFREAEEINFLTKKELKALFPSAGILPETFCYVAKSFYIFG